MAKYERLFGARPGERVGQVVEMSEAEAAPLVQWGRLRPVEAPKAFGPVEAPKPGAKASKGDA